jgi:cyclophilin family peptidyl-prolyl cis-trans isomerase
LKRPESNGRGSRNFAADSRIRELAAIREIVQVEVNYFDARQVCQLFWITAVKGRILVYWRLGFFLALVMLPTSGACAQVVRFQTSVGDFDLVLNPTSSPALQGHVDNMLHYVLSGRYDATVINRAARDFVLQMGGFEALSPAIPATVNGFPTIATFDPIHGVPASDVGLSNTIGTVGLALSGDGRGGINHDSGQSSFYVNLNNNSFLDNDFPVFARVANMTTINSIMALPTRDLTSIPAFGADPGNLAFTDVPIQPNSNLVFIRRAFVVQSSVNPKGDYNGNGKVDSADYVAWRKSQAAGIIGAGLAGDGNQNGVVDGDDYNIWRAHFGAITVSGMGQSPVPEPSLGAFLLPLLTWCCGRRFERRHFAHKNSA